ncbi:MAG: hypothetical protein DI598_14295, partial [Pseudopedobacter saltans]
MNLIILGTNSDDKGFQLEKLTTKILSHLGYKDIVTNFIGSGGQEIDVVGKIEKPGLNGLDITPILCECKAYKSPLAMGDWLKFLGKVFIQETKESTTSYFIALNGVNGNVLGNYSDLQKTNKKVHLVTGVNLMAFLNEMYQIAPINLIHNKLFSLSNKNPIEITMCYYSEKIYYLIGFDDNTFALFNFSHQNLNIENSKNIIDLIYSNTSYINYLNLENEKEAKDRKEKIKKFVTCVMFARNKDVALDELVVNLSDYERQFENFTKEEVDTATTELIEENWILKKGNNYKLKVLKNKTNNGKEILDFLRYLFSNELPLFVLECSNYDIIINKELLGEVARIQGNITFNEKQANNLLELLKLSPSALGWIIHPIQLILRHRENVKDLD